MSRPRSGVDFDANDAQAIRKASRAVGLQITITSSVLVLAVLVAAFTFVFAHITPAALLNFNKSHETTIDVGVVDILLAALVIGAIAIVLAGTMSWFATRRAVRPLAQALRIQRAFVADASHELRTPLAVLDARLQLVQRSLDDDHTFAPTVAAVRRDTKILIEIVNDLLAAADAGGDDQRSRVPVEINPVLRLAVESMRIVAAERAIDIVLDEGETLGTFVPAGSIHRCVVALLDNALRYAPSGSTVTVTLGETKTFVELTVGDRGPGIQGIEPSRIFDRFARSETAQQGDGSGRAGYGIGLALVRETVARHGGSASVADTSESGTLIRLLLPRARLR